VDPGGGDYFFCVKSGGGGETKHGGARIPPPRSDLFPDLSLSRPLPSAIPPCSRAGNRETLRFYFIAPLCGTHKPRHERLSAAVKMEEVDWTKAPRPHLSPFSEENPRILTISPFVSLARSSDSKTLMYVSGRPTMTDVVLNGKRERERLEMIGRNDLPRQIKGSVSME